MTLLGPFDRPLAIRVAVPVERFGRPPVVVPARPPVIVPARPPDVTPPDEQTAEDLARIEIACRLTRALLTDVAQSLDELLRLEAAVDELVVVWSPTLYTTNRAELLAALAGRDDAVVDIDVQVEAADHVGGRVLVEWRIVGRFGNAGFINDDVLVEPTHERVESAGVMIHTFEDRRVVRIDCFFDALALLEQVLEPGSRGAI